MFDMATTLGDLSMQVKIGWAIWLAWGVVVLGWYRHARIVAPMAALPAAAMHAVRFTDSPATRQESGPDPMMASGPDISAGSSTYAELNDYSEIPEQR